MRERARASEREREGERNERASERKGERKRERKRELEGAKKEIQCQCPNALCCKRERESE